MLFMWAFSFFGTMCMTSFDLPFLSTSHPISWKQDLIHRCQVTGLHSSSQEHAVLMPCVMSVGYSCLVVQAVQCVIKDVDWVLWVECLWSNFHFHGLNTSPDANCNITYINEWIQPLYALSRAFQMSQILYTTQWGDTKSPDITLIPHLADICFYMAKFILTQVNNLYKLKCPQGVGLGWFGRVNLGLILRYKSAPDS